MIEQWKIINEFPQYSVSNLGRVKNNRTNHIMVGGFDRDGYRQVIISYHKHQYNRRICRLVAIAFIPNPNGYDVVHHINHNKTDNRVENLVWADRREHQSMHNMERLPKPVDQINPETGEIVASYPSVKEAVRQTGFGQTNISECCNGKRTTHKGFKWRYVKVS